MNDCGLSGSSADEPVIALAPAQLGALVALLIAFFVVFGAIRRND